MKTLAYLLLAISVSYLRAQSPDYGHNPEWDKHYDQSMALATKLFPDVAVKDSQLSVTMEKMFWVWGKNDSQLIHLSCYPVILAVEAAEVIPLDGNWNALSPQEEQEVLYDIKTGLLATHDLNAKEAEAHNGEPSSPATSTIPTWKKGDDLGTITTTGGTVYSSVKLDSVDPDGITILDSDGGAKISFDKLPIDLQKRFGYDPEKAASYAQTEAYENQIAQLSGENAKLRDALSRYKGAYDQTQAAPKIGVEAFHTYLNQTIMPYWNGGHGVTGGPYAGMTLNGAEEAARQTWAQMSDDQKATYEKMAQQTGDPGDPLVQQQERDTHFFR